MCTGRLSQACPWGHGLYSSVVERQSCKLKVLGSIPSEGSFVRDGMVGVGNISRGSLHEALAWISKWVQA